MKQIKMIAWFNENGILMSIKYQIKGDGEEAVTIRIGKISVRGEENWPVTG